MKTDATGLSFEELNRKIDSTSSDITVNGCMGQRFMAAGQTGRKFIINGTPGNALGAYLNGASVIVNGNAQEATGDTMNDGEIVVYGSCGDAAGYAMRGGKIYIMGNVGYRAGIHMKEYDEKKPLMIIGGGCGSFLGEYQAGGTIVVLGMGCSEDELLGNFCAAGMHGGRIIIRAQSIRARLPEQIRKQKLTPEEMPAVRELLDEYINVFGFDKDEVFSKPFWLLTPNTDNPYKQMYVQN